MVDELRLSDVTRVVGYAVGAVITAVGLGMALYGTFRIVSEVIARGEWPLVVILGLLFITVGASAALFADEV